MKSVRVRGQVKITNQLSSDPADPADGGAVIWMSDGTGTGEDGDLMVKLNNGSTVTRKISTVNNYYQDIKYPTQSGTDVNWNGTTPVDIGISITLDPGTWFLTASHCLLLRGGTNACYLYLSTANDSTAKNVGVRVAGTEMTLFVDSSSFHRQYYSASVIVTPSTSTTYYIMGNLNGAGTEIMVDYSIAGGLPDPDMNGSIKAVRIE